MGERKSKIERITKETNISLVLDIDGVGNSQIQTGIGFFDHMLEQLAFHSKIDLTIEVQGDLHIDEHHTIEDVAISLGQAFKEAFGDKVGMERYGFFNLVMDEALAQVALDFSGRSWLVWKTEFKREKVGQMPTEMFKHFFKSWSDQSQCTLHITCDGENEHHKIEAIFKAFAKSILMAKKIIGDTIQSTKGSL
jgi:imidazoleglycerol-phosphate dehydratase / histidinol-phosphatase